MLFTKQGISTTDIYHRICSYGCQVFIVHLTHVNCATNWGWEGGGQGIAQQERLGPAFWTLAPKYKLKKELAL